MTFGAECREVRPEVVVAAPHLAATLQLPELTVYGLHRSASASPRLWHLHAGLQRTPRSWITGFLGSEESGPSSYRIMWLSTGVAWIVPRLASSTELFSSTTV